MFASCDFLESSSENVDESGKEKIYNGVRKNYLKGKLASTVTYKDSLKNGPAINYYPDGKINMEFNYKNNKKHGPYKWYFEDGKTYMEGTYQEGKKEGVFKTYRPDGTLKSEMPWHQDEPCVGLKEYFSSGKEKPVPIIVTNHRNTIRLNGEYSIDLSLSDKNTYVKFFEGGIGEKNSFREYFPAIKKKQGKVTLTVYVAPGQVLMKTITIVAKIKTQDKNYYILTKKMNISIENRY